jgi:hypothetical protein
MESSSTPFSTMHLRVAEMTCSRLICSIPTLGMVFFRFPWLMKRLLGK